MKNALLALAAVAALWSSARPLPRQAVEKPYVYREDFESGEPRSWASYPPAQDVAWDPSLLPSSDPAQGRYSLGRTIQAVRAGRVSFGLIKRISFLTSPSSRLKFSYRIHSYFGPEFLQVVLCGGDGKRYVHTIPTPPVDRWLNVDLPFDRFRVSDRAPQPGLEIQSVYWELHLPNASPQDRNSLYLDDLEVTGNGPALPEEPLPAAFTALQSLPSGVHPRLYFRQKDREELLARTKDPATARLWNDIQAHARQFRTTVNVEAGREIPKLASNPSFDAFRPYSRILREVAALVQTNAFVYWMTGDAEAGLAARRALLEACRWETWTLPWFRLHGQHTYYPAGIFSAALGFGYDLLHADLSAEERALVQRAVLEKGAIPSYREYYVNNRLPFPTSNWIGHTAGGPLIALLAVSEDAAKAEPYFSALFQKLREHWEATYLPDGSYGEGIGYQGFDLETSVRFLAAAKNVLGVDLAAKYHLAGSHLYPLYASQHPDRYLDFGDTGDRLGALTPWAWLASNPSNPHRKWYYGQYVKQRGTVEDDRRSSSVLFDFIWHDPQPNPQPPVNLPASRFFPDKGGAIFRSGWDPDALILNFTAGPFFNHNHLDQGSFLLSGFGETLLAEAGPTEYYTDEFYQPYFIQSVGHNVVLVDGDPASQRIADHRSAVAALNRYPRISTALSTEAHDQVRADLQPVYEPALKRFTRTIMFVKPRYFVLFDQLGSQGKHQYSQVFHPQFAEDLEVGGGEAWIRKDKARLWMKFLAPGDVRLTRRPGHIPMRDIQRLNSMKLKDRAYLEASTREAGEQAGFLVLLFPQRSDDKDLPAVEKIEGNGLVGLRVHVGERQERIGFALKDGTPLRYQDVATDGRSFRVSAEQGQVRVASFEEATYLEAGEQAWWRSDKPISGVVSREAGRIAWHVSGSAPTLVTLPSESEPREVLLDGRRLAPSDYSYHPEDRFIRLRIAEGRHVLELHGTNLREAR